MIAGIMTPQNSYVIPPKRLDWNIGQSPVIFMPTHTWARKYVLYIDSQLSTG